LRLIQTAISPGAVVKLTAALGKLDSVAGPDGLEFRVWSRYRVEDLRDSSTQYERRLEDGTVIQLGPHIDAGGNSGRIYFCIDDTRTQVIVGHVGKHLPGKRDS
jgi:hypothetical protein